MRLWICALLLLLACPAASAPADAGSDIEHLVRQEIARLLPDDGGGIAVAVRRGGRTQFFTQGWAEVAGGRPIIVDSLFNLASLRKLFEAVLIAQAVQRRELSLDDPVSKYLTELTGDYIRRVTIGQLATYTSGLLLRQDYEPWPDWGYTLPEFIATLNAFKPDRAQQPGEEHIYTHAGYVLLQLMLERRFAMPIGELMRQRILEPLGLGSSVLPQRGADHRADLPPALMARAVQGYGRDGAPIGLPGNQQGFYHFAGTGQMFASLRDLAVFVTAHLGEFPDQPELHAAMQVTHQPRWVWAPHQAQALAWEVNLNFDPPLVEKNAGLNNASGYIGLIPEKKLGIVILSNRGSRDAAEAGRRLLAALARD
jgi:beta-lactamase class C